MTKDTGTLISLFVNQLEKSGTNLLSYERVDRDWVPRYCHEVLDMVKQWALGLHDMGVKKGDRIGMLCSCRPEWPEIDQAILANGAVTVGIYTTLPANQVKYILDHAEIEIVFCETRELLALIREAKPKTVKTIVYINPDLPDGPDGPDGPDNSDIISLDSLAEKGGALLKEKPNLFESLWTSVTPDDLATIVYTSGTTGPPKGAMLTHGNLQFIVDSMKDILPADDTDIGVIFLPYEHVLQRMANYCGIDRMGKGAFVKSVDRDDIRWAFQTIRPTIQASVPRLWEKLHHAIHTEVAKERKTRQNIFWWAHGIGMEAAKYRKEKKPLPLGLRFKFSIADRILQKAREKIFGGRVKYLTSGGAPISVEILDFFYGMGLLVIEGYGLTETAAPATLNLLDDFKFGTVGKPIPGTDVKIAEDGEILIKGPGVMKGYYKDPEATKACITESGWFHSGDIGKFDEDGFLLITDRKKNIIVLSTGKNVAPQNVENLIKDSPYVSNALAHGDNRKFMSALVTLDVEAIEPWAKTKGVDLPPDQAEWGDIPEVKELVESAIQNANSQLAGFESVKRWAILPIDFTTEDGSLTPTQKLKRRVIEKRYADILDNIYEPEKVGAK